MRDARDLAVIKLRNYSVSSRPWRVAYVPFSPLLAAAAASIQKTGLSQLKWFPYLAVMQIFQDTSQHFRLPE